MKALNHKYDVFRLSGGPEQDLAKEKEGIMNGTWKAQLPSGTRLPYAVLLLHTTGSPFLRGHEVSRISARNAYR